MEFEGICLNCFSQRGAYEVCPYCGYIAGTPPKEPYLLGPGTRLWGRYVMGTVLGVGGFGVTYKAWDTRLGAMVAIKEFFPQGLVSRIPGEGKVRVFSGEKTEQYQAQLRRFMDEAKNMAKFTGDEHIVGVLDFFEDNGTAYIVMEYLDGLTLKEYTAQSGGRLPQDVALVLEAGILKGLSSIHKKGIIHRDISPDNVFVLRGGGLKLLDFGAARFAAAEGSELSQSVVVKKGYAPPEQYRTNMKQGVWTDIYAAGATLYKMLTGITPEESIERSEHDRLASVTQSGAAVDAAVERAIVRAMALKPELRFKSADAMLAVLENRTMVDEPEVELKKRKKRSALAVVLSCVALVLCIGIVGWQLSQTPASITIGGGPSLANMDIKPDTITVMTLLSEESIYDAVAAQNIQRTADAFMEKYPEHTVEVEIAWYNYGEPGRDYSTVCAALAPRMTTEDAPAVFDMGFYSELGDVENYCADLTPLVNALQLDDYIVLDEYYASRHSRGQDDKAIYAAPMQSTFEVGYGRAGVAAQCGFELPERFTSIDEIFELERQYPGAVELHFYQFHSLLTALHPNIDDDSAELARVTAEFAELYNQGYFRNYDGIHYDEETGDPSLEYVDGGPAVYFEPCDVGARNNLERNGAIQYIPLEADGQVLCDMRSYYYVSSSVSENQQKLGMLYLHFLYSELGQQLMYLSSLSSLPVNGAVLDSFVSTHGMDSLFTPAFESSLHYNTGYVSYRVYQELERILDAGGTKDDVYDYFLNEFGKEDG